jgi:hypothetical protein
MNMWMYIQSEPGMESGNSRSWGDAGIWGRQVPRQSIEIRITRHPTEKVKLDVKRGKTVEKMVKVRSDLALRKGADNCEGSELLDWFRSTFRVFFDRTHFFVYGSNFERVTWMLRRRDKVGSAMGRALHIDNEMLAELFGVSKQTIGRVDESAEGAIDPIRPFLSILSTAYKCQLQIMAQNVHER